MKKKKLYLVGATIFLMITVILIKIFDGNQQLEIGEKRQEGDFIEIYELEDGRKVYTNFEEIKYISKTKREYSLADALKKKKTTIDSIIFKRDEWSGFNDGGTNMYNFYAKNRFVNKDIIIYKCHATRSISETGAPIFNTDIYIVDKYISDTPCFNSPSKETAS